MTCPAKSDQLVNQFIATVRVCGMMDMLNGIFSTPLANAILALEYCVSLFLPSAAC
jgi:hypothetical protein